MKKLWMFVGKHELLLEKQRFGGDTYEEALVKEKC